MGGHDFPDVYALAVQTDGKILAGGEFTALAGQPRSCLGRLKATEPATQTLGYDGSTFTWLRGGTSPEVWRTTFAHSTNDVAWKSLGAGTRIPNGWQLTGVSLPSVGTIRARGRVTGGGGYGSDWFVESKITAPWGIRLNVLREGSSVRLHWTGEQDLYQVQQAVTLGSSNSWVNVGGPVQTNTMALPIGPGNLFLRVRGQ